MALDILFFILWLAFASYSMYTLWIVNQEYTFTQPVIPPHITVTHHDVMQMFACHTSEYKDFDGVAHEIVGRCNGDRARARDMVKATVHFHDKEEWLKKYFKIEPDMPHGTAYNFMAAQTEDTVDEAYRKLFRKTTTIDDLIRL